MSPFSDADTTEQPTDTETVAAVDLGSNSFHLIIARATPDGLYVIDRLKEPVRLAAGLTHEHTLSEKARARAIDCLGRFGQRLGSLSPRFVRAVGTNTLRQARHDDAFREGAARALGHPIEVIGGEEEARLIYLGVSHLHGADGRRLVIDIGGGSTEVIVGEGYDVDLAHSLFMGCVSYSRRYFPKGRIEREAFRLAETEARRELQSLEGAFRKHGWSSTLGASGTINAISDILRGEEITAGEITLPALKKLRRLLVNAGSTAGLSLNGLKSDRAPVLAGGLAILIGVFKSLGIDELVRASGALREGVIYDLLGRLQRQDVRERTIQRFMRRYGVDVDQADRLQAFSSALLAQLPDTPDMPHDVAERFLAWASSLHEIGLALSYSGYHKHGAYLVRHSHMPGFSADDQALLAMLIHNHRRGISRLPFGDIPRQRHAFAMRLAILFRLSALLCRSRTDQTPPVIALRDPDTLTVEFPPGWLDEHPLTAGDLRAEAKWLDAVGTRLVVESNAQVGDAPGSS